ncbi:MAG: alpha-ketoacid dehydrogenase subunit beta [Armatimonadetes bacterium]|nr:alpha-ketoacid dehydrogenase subunit beta [Armatimonadota bacterium]
MREVSYVKALNEALVEEMARDESVFLIGEDLVELGGGSGATKGLAGRFGTHRVRQTPLSEAAFVGLAVGAAMTGLRPVAEIMYVDFVTVCMDQIINQAAKLRYMSGGQFTIPLVIRTQGGGGTSEAAQHSQSPEAWFAHTPGLKVVMPATAADAKGLLKSAIRDDNPVIFLEHKLLYATKGEVPKEEYLIPLGQAEVKRPGHDVTLVATSLMVHKSLAAAETIAEEISVEIIDPRTLVPLDIDCINASVRKTGRLLVVQEACTRGGFGSDIVRRVVEACFDTMKTAPRVVGGANLPMPFSHPLETACIPQEESIVQVIKALVGE